MGRVHPSPPGGLGGPSYLRGGGVGAVADKKRGRHLCQDTILADVTGPLGWVGPPLGQRGCHFDAQSDCLRPLGRCGPQCGGFGQAGGPNMNHKYRFPLGFLRGTDKDRGFENGASSAISGGGAPSGKLLRAKDSDSGVFRPKWTTAATDLPFGRSGCTCTHAFGHSNAGAAVCRTSPKD